MHLWRRIKFFMVLFVILLILNWKSANGKRARTRRLLQDDVWDMDYGSTTRWTIRARSTTNVTATDQTNQEDNKLTIVILTTESSLPTFNETLSPIEALNLGKFMVLPESDVTRQDEMKSYADTLEMERKMQEWMRIHVNSTYTLPVNVSLRTGATYVDWLNRRPSTRKITNTAVPNANFHNGVVFNSDLNKQAIRNANFNSQAVPNTNYNYQPFRNANFNNGAVANANFNNQAFRNANFNNGAVTNANFNNQAVRNANSNNEAVPNTNFENTDKPNDNLENATDSNTNFKPAEVSNANFDNGYVQNNNFNESTISTDKHSNFNNVTVPNANVNNVSSNSNVENATVPNAHSNNLDSNFPVTNHSDTYTIVPSDEPHINAASSYTTLTNPGVNTNEATDNAAVTKLKPAQADALNSKIDSVVNHQDDKIIMYDYKAVAWEEMPEMQEIFSTTTTIERTTLSTLYPLDPPQSSMVARAHQQMTEYKMGYLSTFITSVCEIISVSKKGHARKLLIGLLKAFHLYDSQGWLTHIHTRTLDIIHTHFQVIPFYPPDMLKHYLDTIYPMFRNHSHFKPKMREIIGVIESWYEFDEGEHLLKTLQDISDWPNIEKKPEVIGKEIMDALFHPYIRMGAHDPRRIKLLDDVEEYILNYTRPQYDRRHIKIDTNINNSKNLRAKTLEDEDEYSNSESIEKRMEKKKKAKMISIEIVNEYQDESGYDYDNYSTEISKDESDQLIYDMRRHNSPILVQKDKHKAKYNFIKNVSSYLYTFTTRKHKNKNKHLIMKNEQKSEKYTFSTSEANKYDKNNKGSKTSDVLKKEILNDLRITVNHRNSNVHRKKSVEINDNVIKHRHKQNKPHSSNKLNNTKGRFNKTKTIKTKREHFNSNHYYDYMISREKPEDNKHRKLHKHSKSTRNKHKNFSKKPNRLLLPQYKKPKTLNMYDEISDTFERYDVMFKKHTEHEYDKKLTKYKENQNVFRDKHKYNDKDFKMFPITTQRIMDYYDSKSKESLLKERILYEFSKSKRKNGDIPPKINNLQKRYKVVIPRENSQLSIYKLNDAREPNHKISRYLGTAINSDYNNDNKKIDERFHENFKTKQEIAKKNVAKNFLEESSYSDAELDIKIKLSDALRHGDKKILKNSRRRINIPEKKTIRDVTSEIDEEGIIKNNIYKVFGNKINNG